jgi:hypothetical protein
VEILAKLTWKPGLKEKKEARSGNPRGEYQLSPKKCAKSALL